MSRKGLEGPENGLQSVMFHRQLLLTHAPRGGAPAGRSGSRRGKHRPPRVARHAQRGGFRLTRPRAAAGRSAEESREHPVATRGVSRTHSARPERRGRYRDGVPGVRLAGPQDADTVGRPLDAFNREFAMPSPGPVVLARRIRVLLDGAQTEVLLAGGGPDAVAVLRFRPAIWSEALECHVAKLYVVPSRRRRGLGRVLMRAAIELARERGADYMDLATGEDELPARALYEQLGLRSGRGGARNLHYERDL